MIGALTWKIGAIALAAALAATLAGAAVDGLRNRATIAELRRGSDKLAGWLGESQRNVGTCNANVTTLGSAVDHQSDEIRALADESKAAGDRAAAAGMLAAQNAKAAARAADALLKRPAPTPADACVASVNLLRGLLE